MKPGGSDRSLEAILEYGLGQPRLRKMGCGASGPGICRFDKENVPYFNKDLEGLQIRENWPSSLEPQDELT